MADVFYHNIAYLMMTQAVNLSTSGDALKLALMLTGHSASTVDDAIWTDVSASEASGTGYTAGGVAITGTAVVPRDDDTDNTAVLDITEDPTWTTSTIANVYYAVLYDDTHASDALICSFDVTGPKSSSGGDFVVQFSTTPATGACFTIG